MNPETELQTRILAASSEARHARLFRNTVGQGWMGNVVGRQGAVLLLAHARPVTFGLCPGSSDLVGWRSVDGVAQFVALEVKTARGRLADNQENFIERLRTAGGLAEVVRSPDAALEALRR